MSGSWRVCGWAGCGGGNMLYTVCIFLSILN